MRRPTPRPRALLDHPHPLELGRLVAVELQRAAPDRLVVQPGQQQQAGRLDEIGGVRREAGARIEAVAEARVELSEIGPQAEPGGAARRIGDPDLDQGGAEQPLNRAHGVDEPGPLPVVQRRQQGPRQSVAAPVEFRAFGAPGFGEPYGPHPVIVWSWLHLDQALVLEPAQQAAQIAGVQVEPAPDGPEVSAAVADLPQHPRGSQRTRPGQVLLLKRADPLGHGPVEPSNRGDEVIFRHVL